MIVTVTDSAKEYLYSIAKKNNKDIISFGVSGGGCAGWFLGMFVNDSDHVKNRKTSEDLTGSIKQKFN